MVVQYGILIKGYPMIHPNLMDICEGVYQRMIINSEKRGHPLPSFNEYELFAGYFKSDLARKLYKNYIDSYNGVSYDSQLSLTIDRLDNTKGYSIDNLNGLMTFYDNACLYQKGRRKPCAIYKYNKKDGLLHLVALKDSFMDSAKFISESTGLFCDHSMVKACCLGRINYTCSCYTARFTEEDVSPLIVLKPLCEPGSKPKQFKKVKQLCKITGELINIFNSIGEAAKYVKGSPAEISRVCSGSRKVKTHRGFIWEYQ